MKPKKKPQRKFKRPIGDQRLFPPCVTCDVKYEIIESFFHQHFCSYLARHYLSPLALEVNLNPLVPTQCANDSLLERKDLQILEAQVEEQAFQILEAVGRLVRCTLYFVLSILECPTACLLHLDLART